MGAEGINFTGVTVTLNSVSNSGLMQARKDENRYRKRSKHMLQREVNGAIDRASNLFGNMAPCATFEQNFFAGWAHSKKTMQPELASKVSGAIYTCWKVGESKSQGKEKISHDGVFARLDELQLQKAIRLSELPLVL